MGRPRPLPLCATDVTDRARELAAGHFKVWRRYALLSARPEGCTLPIAELAAQVGLALETVITYRQDLVRWGLLVNGPHPDYGASTTSWYATLPVSCWPENRTQAELRRCAAALDVHLRAVRERTARGSDSRPPPRSDRSPPRRSDSGPTPVGPIARRTVAAIADGVGGVGGGFASAVGTESPLVSAVTESEAETKGALHPKAEAKRARAETAEEKAIRLHREKRNRQ